jgi:hypothetical protein
MTRTEMLRDTAKDAPRVLLYTRIKKSPYFTGRSGTSP